MTADALDFDGDTPPLQNTPIVHEEFQGLRITPNVYTTLGELDRFAKQMERIARTGLPS